MDYDQKSLGYSRHAFGRQYDAYRRPLQSSPPYKYNRRVSPVTLPPAPEQSPRHQEFRGVSIRGRASRSRGRGRRQPKDNRRPSAAGARAEYDPNSPLIDADVNVNAIEISNARNRLFDRARTRSVQQRLDQRQPQLQNSVADSQLQPPDTDFRRQMASTNGAPPTPAGTGAPRGRTRRLPNHVQIADAYIFQQTIDERLRRVGVTQAREDALRLAGVQWIDQVRKALRL